MNGTHGVTRRPRKERYFYTVPSKELPREWMASVLGMIEVILDYPGVLSLQDVVDSLDYGPHQLLPREREQALEVKKAWDRSVAEQCVECKLGNHRFQRGKCWYCDETQLKVVDE